MGRGLWGGADAPVPGFCQKLPNKHQGSQYSGAVFSTTLPLHCWAELANHPIFLNLIKSFKVYIFRGIAHALGKARPHGRPGRRGAGRRSGLRPYPPLGAARSFSIVAPRPEPIVGRGKSPHPL